MMGLIDLKSMDLYWSSDPFYFTTKIRNVMTCKRFKELMEAFHCNDNETAASMERHDMTNSAKFAVLLTI